jgi:hypothetical protein
MILGKDIHPERKIYYIGSLVLKVLKATPQKTIDFFHIYQKVNESRKVSMRLFILTLDWLFLLGLIKTDKGCIIKCF